MSQEGRPASSQRGANRSDVGGGSGMQGFGQHLLRKLLLQRSRPSRDQGIALPIAVVAGLVLVIGVVALSSRASQGLIASIFQGENRDARDVAESAISDFGVTMNREENRFLLVAGNDSNWSDIKHRNICTASTQAADGSWSTVTKDLDEARAASTPVSASRFVKGDTWQPLIAGDTTRSFKVTKIEYFFEKDSVDADSGDVSRNRELFNFGTESPSFPGKTVRDAALEGGSRTLLRVTVVGRVVRNGQTSYARVAREFEVVPKCCKRSFGNNIGAIPWGRDNAPCPVEKDRGVGNGVIGSLDGGAPSGSNNELDIRDEDNELITQAICWSGNDPNEASDLTGAPNPDCVDGEQRLGKASKNKSSVSFIPTEFSLKLPDPLIIFGNGGRLAPKTSAALNPSSLDGLYPYASFGTWVSDDDDYYWMRRYVDKTVSPLAPNWISFPSRSAAPSATRNFSVCIADGDISLCMREADRLGGVAFPQVSASANPLPANSEIPYWSGSSRSSTPVATTYGSNTRIYLNPNDLTMYQRVGSVQLAMPNCVTRKDPGAPYAVVDCKFSRISAGNREIIIDTSYAMINFHFVDNAVTGDYMGGGGNTAFKRVHCARPASLSSWSPTACNTVVPWIRSSTTVTDFQTKCDPAAPNRDPNCLEKNSNYDHSELWNAFTFGGGSFSLNGTSQSVGVNVYAPFATVELKGGGNADPNFMGRIWADNIALNGNVKLRVPNSQPSFCSTSICPPPSKVPLFDVVARSFSHASGF